MMGLVCLLAARPARKQVTSLWNTLISSVFSALPLKELVSTQWDPWAASWAQTWTRQERLGLFSAHLHEDHCWPHYLCGCCWEFCCRWKGGGKKSKQQDIQPTFNVSCNCWKLAGSHLCIRHGTAFVHGRPFTEWANCSTVAVEWSWHQSIAMLLIGNVQNTSLSATTHQGLTQESIAKILMGYEDDHSNVFSLKFC